MLFRSCSKKIAIFRTANFSVGVNLLVKLVKEAAEALGEQFDIEIIEKHHNRKVDAPSGTALMLADGANAAFGGEKEFLYGREGAVGKRKSEIGIHAVRGGTIVGEHDVMFAGEDEIITLSHSARSKRVFAAGAVKAAKWLVGKSSGKYDMNDVFLLFDFIVRGCGANKSRKRNFIRNTADEQSALHALVDTARHER